MSAARARTRSIRLLTLALGALAVPAPAAPLDDRDRHAFAIVDQQVGDVLREFAGATGRAVDLGEGVDGRLTNFRGNYTARGFLDAVAARSGLVWYDDGAAIHVSGADAMRSVVIDFDRVPARTLTAALVDLGVADDRFALRRTSAGIGIVTGPPRYVEMVESTFLMLADRQSPEVAGGAAHAMTIVRGEEVTLWRGVAEEALADAPAATEPPQ